MFRQLPHPAGGISASAIIPRKRIRAQVRAETILSATRARSERMLAQAQEEAERIIDDSRHRVETALHRGFDIGLSNAYGALGRYWLDSVALNETLLQGITASLRTLLSEKISSPTVIATILEALLEQQGHAQTQPLTLTLPQSAMDHASDFLTQLRDRGFQGQIQNGGHPHKLIIDWGAHSWTFDANEFASQMIDSALEDHVSGALLNTTSGRQTADALRSLADQLSLSPAASHPLP